jgi:TonB family protein
LIGSADVTYPTGARGEGSVVLFLTIGIDGYVKEAKAVEGDAPFASAAETAARSWRFEPATRDGRAVSARIRFLIKFTPPTPAEPEPEQPPPATDAGTSAAGAGAGGAPSTGAAGASRQPGNKKPPAPAKPQAIEVTVYGRRAAPGAVSFGRAEVRQLPGAFGDPFRAIEAMPGVTPIVSGIPFFYVRGAPPGNIGYYLDGVRVPYLYHVGLGPSVIHPGMVDRVDLYPGGYPAQFGRFAGGIVSADSTTPRTDLHGEGNIRLFDMGALVESGFANGKGTVLLAGRYSYTAAILSLIAKDIKLDYRDYEARVTYDLTPRDRITLFSFGAYDLIGQTVNGIYNTLFGSEFYRLDTRWDHQFGPGSAMRAAVTLGIDQTRVPSQPRNQRDNMVQARVEGFHALSSVATMRGGADLTVDAYRADTRPYADPEDPDTIRFNGLFPPRNDVAVGGWTDVVFKFRGVEVTPGVRVDLFRSGSASAVGVDPRISSRIKLAEKVHMIHALGVAHQPPSFIIPVPGLAIGSLQGGLQRSVQASAGVEVQLPESMTATLTAFDNIFLNMSDTLGVSQRGRGGEAFLGEQRSLGSAKGVEFYLKRRLTHRLGGYLAYTLSRSTRSVGTEHFPSTFDRTHVANAALAYNLGRNWRAGTRFTLYTGAPSQPASNSLIPAPIDPHPSRDPIFYRVDIRLEKRWTLSKTAWWSFVAEIMNATLHKEILMGRSIGPVTIPSVGLEAGF